MIKNRLVSILCSAVLSAFVLSCSSGSDNMESLKIIDLAGALASKPVEMKLGDIASDIEYIPLDMGEEFLPDYQMMEMIVADGEIYFVPKPNHPAVPIFHFSGNGKLVSHFKHIGRAENEYVIPCGVAFDRANGLFILNDCFRTVKYYTPSGEYKNSIKLDELEYDIVPGFITAGNSVRYIARSKDNKKLYALELGESGNVVGKDILIDYSNCPQEYWGEGTSVKLTSELISKSSHSCTLLHKFSDSIYTYNGSGDAEVAFVIDFGNLKDGIERKIYIGGYCYESSKFLILQIIYSVNYFDNLDPAERMNYLLIDKTTGKGTLLAKDEGNKAYLKNNLDGGMPFFPYHIDGDKMYQLVDACQFIEYAEAAGSKAMLDVAANLTEESNPVLVIATLK